MLHALWLGELAIRHRQALAKRFGTSLATVQRCVGIRQSAAGKGHHPFNC